MSDTKTFQATIVVSGGVQGVGYRNFAAAEANRLGLGGYAKNLRDGRVEVRLEGSREIIDTVIGRLRIGPPSARVEAVEVRWQAGGSGVRGFTVG
ncbi:MAG: acylphosphatase [Nitrospiria bacterium]